MATAHFRQPILEVSMIVPILTLKYFLRSEQKYGTPGVWRRRRICTRTGNTRGRPAACFPQTTTWRPCRRGTPQKVPPATGLRRVFRDRLLRLVVCTRHTVQNLYSRTGLQINPGVRGARCADGRLRASFLGFPACRIRYDLTCRLVSKGDASRPRPLVRDRHRSPAGLYSTSERLTPVRASFTSSSHVTASGT